MLLWLSTDQHMHALVQGMKLLCYANVGQPPPDSWQQSYLLLSRGIDAYMDSLPAGAASHMSQVAASLDLNWYCRVLARVHINAFR